MVVRTRQRTEASIKAEQRQDIPVLAIEDGCCSIDSIRRFSR